MSGLGRVLVPEIEEDMFEVGVVTVVTPPTVTLAGERLVPVTGDPDDDDEAGPTKPSWS